MTKRSASRSVAGVATQVIPCAAMPGVARGDDDLGALGEGPGERVLARARADDDAASHAVRTNCSRPGPTPTTEMGTPVVSSRNLT